MDQIWEELFSSQEWGKYPPEHVVRFVARTFYRSPVRKAVKLLEVGCGPGANVWYMAKEGFDAYGIDGSPSAIRYAEGRLYQEKLSATLIVGDFCALLPWPDNFFDGVVENVALYSNPKAKILTALAEIRRVLKPEGKLQSSWFSSNTWGCGLGNEIEPNGFDSISEGPLANRGFSLFVDENQLRELLTDFRIESIEKTGFTLAECSKQVEQWVAVVSKQP